MIMEEKNTSPPFQKNVHFDLSKVSSQNQKIKIDGIHVNFWKRKDFKLAVFLNSLK